MMADIIYTPSFTHRDWIDNEDRVQAGGENGFNVRFNALAAELKELSAVIAQINGSIAQNSASVAQIDGSIAQIKAGLANASAAIGSPTMTLTFTPAFFPSTEFEG